MGILTVLAVLAALAALAILAERDGGDGGDGTREETLNYILILRRFTGHGKPLWILVRAHTSHISPCQLG